MIQMRSQPLADECSICKKLDNAGNYTPFVEILRTRENLSGAKGPDATGRWRLRGVDLKYSRQR